MALSVNRGDNGALNEVLIANNGVQLFVQDPTATVTSLALRQGKPAWPLLRKDVTITANRAGHLGTLERLEPDWFGSNAGVGSTTLNGPTTIASGSYYTGYGNLATGQFYRRPTVIGAFPYTCDNRGHLTDDIVCVYNTSGAGVSITLPAAGTDVGRVITITDIGNNADSKNITIHCAGSDNFGLSTGVTTQVINSALGSLSFVSLGALIWAKVQD